MGVASLVLGIVSIVCSFFGYGAIVGVILGIAGVILGAIGRKNVYKQGVATAGLVCSIIGLVLSSILFIACVACVGCASAF